MSSVTPTNPISAMDFLPRERLRSIQSERLKHMVRISYDNVPLFRKRMDERGLTPDCIQSIDDIHKLPFTIKADLRESYPFGLMAVPMKDIVRLHASSGTTGKPIVVAYTKEDLGIWANAVSRAYAACGVQPGDIAQVSYGYGLFTGGLGAHYGLEALGVTVVPASGGNTERQIMLMKDFGVTVITCTPSYFIHMIEVSKKMGIDMKSMPLRIGVFGAEPWTEEMRAYIEQEAGIKAYDIYGLSEITGPGVGCGCGGGGLHIFEDLFYPEIIDPETLEPLPDGEEGELVLSTLAKNAMPMLRYRTRDISRIICEPCACGRTIRRICKISRRSDDMFIIRGVNVFPSQIETAIMKVESSLPVYQIILTRDHSLDNVEVDIELTSDVFSDDTMSALEDIRHRISQSIEHTLGIRVFVKMVAPNSIPRSEGKAKRVIDKRNLNEGI